MPEEEKDPVYYTPEGHPKYPKWVTDREGKRVVVATPEEEKEVALIATPEETKPNSKKSKADW